MKILFRVSLDNKIIFIKELGDITKIVNFLLKNSKVIRIVYYKNEMFMISKTLTYNKYEMCYEKCDEHKYTNLGNNINEAMIKMMDYNCDCILLETTVPKEMETNLKLHLIDRIINGN